MEIDPIDDALHLCARLRTDGTKANFGWFLNEGGGGGRGAGKQVKKSANTKNRGRLKDNNGKLWPEEIIVTSQMQ